MKFVIFFFFGLFCTFVNAQAKSEGEDEKPGSQDCRLASLIPKGSLHLPDFNIGPGGTPSEPLPDPLELPDSAIALEEENISGNYSFRNGLVTGLSTLDYKFSYQLMLGRIFLNATVKHLRLTGDYEVVYGKVNYTGIGYHTYYGSGPLNASASDVNLTLSTSIRFDPQGHLKLNKLKANLTFESVYIKAENLTINEVPVDWEIINALIKPTFDMVWEEANAEILQYIENEINWLLEGCTVQDLIDIIQPPQQGHE